MSASPSASLEKAGGAAAPAERRASHKWLVAVAVMLGATLEVLDTSIVNVSLPHMQGSFSASRDEVTWILTSYIVANGIMIPLTGWISARFGRKRYFLLSVVVFVIASGLCGAAHTLVQMVIFRLIQGAAGAAMIPSSQAIMMETFPPEEQGLAMSVWGMGLLTSPMLGPTLGGWITYNWNWRWNFYINLPIGIFAAIMVFDLRPRSGAYSEVAGAGTQDRLSRVSPIWRLASASYKSCWIAGSGPTGSIRMGLRLYGNCGRSRWSCWSITRFIFPNRSSTCGS